MCHCPDSIPITIPIPIPIQIDSVPFVPRIHPSAHLPKPSIGAERRRRMRVPPPQPQPPERSDDNHQFQI